MCLLPASREKQFIDTFIKRYTEYHLDNDAENTQTHIVSERQYTRLMSFLNDAIDKGGKVHSVKEVELDQGRRVYPHLVTGLNEDMKIMQEEIFGSISSDLNLR